MPHTQAILEEQSLAADTCCIEERIVTLRGSFGLASGQCLDDVRVAMRMCGPGQAPVVVAMGGISADNCPVAISDENRSAWWQCLLGQEGAALTEGYRVLSFDWLGGCGGTTGPANFAGSPAEFPEINTLDQARLLEALLTELGIDHLHGIVSASYGGMVALHYAARNPQAVAQVLVMGSGHRPEPMAAARRYAQKKVLLLADAGLSEREAVAAARALAMTTYRAPAEFRSRFKGQEGLHQLREYLDYQGEKFSARFDREAYLRLLDSIDSHQVSPRDISVPLSLVAFEGDEVSPPSLMRELADLAPGTQRFITLSTHFGHDAFLCESKRLTPILKNFIQGES